MQEMRDSTAAYNLIKSQSSASSHPEQEPNDSSFADCERRTQNNAPCTTNVTCDDPELTPPPMAAVKFGGYSGEDEDNLVFLADIPDDGHLKRIIKLPDISPSPPAHAHGDHDWLDPMQDDFATPDANEMHTYATPSIPLFSLPSELIHAVMAHLSAYDLAATAATCWSLRKYALSDAHWHRCVQRCIPGVWLSSPKPCASFRELYIAHDRLWFLPKYKLWFCDRDLMGKLILVRYDPRRGCIEGYQLLATSRQSTFEQWAANDKVIIHGFNPEINLHLDKPVLQFHIQEGQAAKALTQRPGANRFADEMPMALDERLGAMFSNFMLTKPLDPDQADLRLRADYPYETVWPPPAIPARHHISRPRSGPGVVDLSYADRPQSRAQVSDQTFRIRQWMELAGTPIPPPYALDRTGTGAAQSLAAFNLTGNRAGGGTVGVHIGEEIIAYTTLDPSLYTPTETKPWRGIWVGDYGGHGCEFLLIHQPDDPPASNEELGLFRKESETDAQWTKRQHDARVYRGRLEAIKLTGDPNIPRGEYTFVSDDLGPQGHIHDASDAIFSGARVVRSKGHVAAAGFIGDKFIESQLILISPNKLAQHWVEFGSISFFERVDIDPFLKP